MQSNMFFVPAVAPVKMSIPNFRFTLQSPHNSNSGFITLGDERVHRIHDVTQFYKALGYTDKVRKSGLLPEEYIWHEYRRDSSNKSESCLQAKVIEYLFKHSSAFGKKYTEQYVNTLWVCTEEALQTKMNCTSCLLHPNNC